MADEWRVEVDLDDPEHGYGLGERLRSLDLDDQARERLGGRVLVTRDGARMFLYTGSEEDAREAERVVAELIEEDRLTGDLAVTRWDPDAEAWRAAAPADAPVSRTGAERKREDWEVRVDLGGLRPALELQERLAEEGLHVERRFSYLLVGAPTEKAASELAERLRERVPEDATVAVEPNLVDVPDPRFVVLDRARPGIARDLGF